MTTNTILSICFILAWFMLFYMMGNTVKPKKNIILGVTLPHYAHNETETLVICGSFKKWLIITMLPLLLLISPAFFMPSMGLTMIWYMTWLLLLIAIPFVVFARHRSALMALKNEKNWFNREKNLRFDQTLPEKQGDSKIPNFTSKKLNGLYFFPPLFISLIPVVYSILQKTERSMILSYTVFTLLVIMFWLLYYLIFRLRAEIVNEDITLTAALTQVRRGNWGKLCLIASWLTGIFALLLWIFAGNITGYLVITLGYCLFLIAVSLYLEFSTRTAQQKLTATDSGDSYLDEDEYWLFGFLYHNPKDKHFFVNDRIGMNMSVNLAKPAGKVLMAIAVLCIFAMPFIGIWIWMEERTPINLIINETSLIARHTSDRYSIKLNSIESVELLETLPSMVRVSGMGLENLNKGRFRTGSYGVSRVCIQPDYPPFIVLRAGGRTYIFNDTDNRTTREIYSTLRNR